MPENPKTTHIYMFNSPQFFFERFGHSGVIVENPDTGLHLYSFHPVRNEGEPFDKGSIARIVHRDETQSFETFVKACLTHHEEDPREDNRGIILNNGYTTWVERIRRVLKIEVAFEDAMAIQNLCRERLKNPPRFNIITYSCQHFVREAFGAGGVVLWGKHFSLNANPVPNSVYNQATAKTTHALSFSKIDFEKDYPQFCE